jgi:hypothetical protein
MKGKISFAVLLLMSLSLALFFLGCGGGGSGGDSSVGAFGGVSTGSVAVLVTDDPADCYENLYIWVTKVSLIPADDASDQSHEVIFESDSPDGYKVDLLRYQDDEEFLLTLKDDVRADTYAKIRLEVSKIESVAKDPCENPCDCEKLCDKDDWKLPSQKIDLNPRGTFEVEPDGTLFIRLDIDANNSIHASASCNFRPVVFVDIWQGPRLEACPQTVTGIIDSIIADDDDSDDQIEGVVLKRKNLPNLEVFLPPQVPIFDQQGEPGLSPNDLMIDDTITVRGKVKHSGRFTASLVVVMALDDILIVDGIAKGSVDKNGIFLFQPDPGQEIGSEDPVSVEVFPDETQILLGCDTNVSEQYIEAGMRVRIYGKLFLGSDDVIRSFVLLLRSDEIVGDLISIKETEGGSNLTVDVGGGIQTTIFLPEDVPVYMKGDGEIPLDLLQALVSCDPRQVRIVLDPDDETTATDVRVIDDLDPPGGTIISIEDNRVLGITDMGTDTDVAVMPGATIMEPEGTLFFEDIQQGREVQCFGLWACDSDDVDFYGFIIRIHE